MTAILGISAFYHDSAAALVVDGEIVAAAQEERFTRKKHDEAFPSHAVEFCLKHAGLSIDQIDWVTFYEKPLLTFDRLLETYLAFAPRGFTSFKAAIPVWLKQKLHLRREIVNKLGMKNPRRLLFTEHHVSHAASAFFPSPYERAAILTVDGVGEWATASFGVGEGNKITLTHELRFPHSLGLLYSAFTYFCGFRVNSGEYKLMGLAPYGEPRYADLILKHLVDLKPDGSFRMDQSYFGYCDGLTMTSPKFDALFGGPPRKPESAITQREMDLAASVQKVTEEILLRIAHHLHKETGAKHLCLAGGVALNCVANGRILREGPFESIWIQPAAGDAGGSLGAALFTWHQILGKPRVATGHDFQRGSLLGPDFSDDDTRAFLDENGVVYEFIEDEAQLCREVAQILASEQVVGWMQGRMEFGPRALGSRSILGDARSPSLQSLMNLKTKYRESFRPFAPAVLREHVHEYFEAKPNLDSPYMLLVSQVREELLTEEGRRSLGPKAKGRGPEGNGTGQMGDQRGSASTLTPSLSPGGRGEPEPSAQNHPPIAINQEPGTNNLSSPEPSTLNPQLSSINSVRSSVPAITHVDCSARMQTVDSVRNPRFHRLLTEFHSQTGSPLVINTSFNVRGEPIVCTPQDAWNCFTATQMDALVIGRCLIRKKAQTNLPEVNLSDYIGKFPLD
jgi:carbamoyltransferase